MYEDLMRKLAECPPTEMPVLSVYLDMRPQATGRNPDVRSGDIVLKDRLHEIEKTYLPRGADLDSFRSDRERIENFVENEMSPATSGLIIFACTAIGLWETVEVGAELENEVAVGSVPALYQFAKLLDDHETAVVAVVDTNTGRFFVTNFGKLEETDGPDDPDNDAYHKTKAGGWSQSRYQRKVDNTREAFSKEVAADLDTLIKKVDAKNLVIAGDEIAMTLLQNNLGPAAKEILYSEILRIDEKTPRLEIKERVTGILAEIEKENALSDVERLIGAMRGDGLGVAGLNATTQALKNGQVETLLLDPNSDAFSQDIRNDVIRLAATTGANIEMVEGNEKFAAMEGVGGLLRYKLQGEHPANDIDAKYSLDSKDPLINIPNDPESDAVLSAGK